MSTNPDLHIALVRIIGKRSHYDKLWDYYDGDHPLVYSASRLEQVFDKLNTKFIENWIQVVVDAAVDRINLNGWNAEDKSAKAELEGVFNLLDLRLDASDVHLAAVVTGESFILGGKDEDGKPEAYYNDPRLVHVEYDWDNPKKKRFACKIWKEEPGYCACLYYEDRTEKFITDKKWEEWAVSQTPSDSFNEAGTVETPVEGTIPVFHFRVTRRKNKGDIDTILTLQDAVNKLLSDMMVGAEFSAFKQRWVISNADTTTLPNAPNQIILLPAGDGEGQPTAVGEFTETNLGGFLSAIDRIAQSIAIISRTPKHYLFAQGGDPSGEALIAMEAPLIRRVESHIERFTVAWQEVAEFLLAVNGTDIEPEEVTLLWGEVATLQPRTEAEIRTLNKTAGIPLLTTLRRAGWNEDELKQLEKDQNAERVAVEASEARLMANSLMLTDRGGEDRRE